MFTSTFCQSTISRILSACFALLIISSEPIVQAQSQACTDAYNSCLAAASDNYDNCFDNASGASGRHACGVQLTSDHQACSAAQVVCNSHTQATSVILSASQNPSIIGTVVTFTATVTTGTTGTVTFYDGASSLGSTTLINSVATIASTLSAGAHSITAVYSGDSNYLGSASTALSQVMMKPVDMTLVSIPNPSTPGSLVVLTATTVVGATGSIAFTDSSSNLISGPVAVSSDGTASVSVSVLGVGSYVYSAVYSGDQTYSMASATTTVVVNVPAVIASITPNVGQVGTQVSIKGAGFGVVPGTVLFSNNIPANIISWSDTLILVIVPATAITGPMEVVISSTVSSAIFTVSSPTCQILQ